MKSVHQTYKIHAPLSKVWQALVDPSIIDKWGAGPATMDDKEGTSFSLWGGSIHGTNTKVQEHKLLQQDWYSGDKWPEASKVSFVLHKFGPITSVTLRHTHIPASDAADIAEGWKEYYLGPLKDYLESK